MNSIISNNFNAYIDQNNKWTIIFTNKEGKVINLVSVPPTNKTRFDIICMNDLKSGYSYGIDAIIIKIENENISLAYTNN